MHKRTAKTETFTLKQQQEQQQQKTHASTDKLAYNMADLCCYFMYTQTHQTTHQHICVNDIDSNSIANICVSDLVVKLFLDTTLRKK